MSSRRCKVHWSQRWNFRKCIKLGKLVAERKFWPFILYKLIKRSILQSCISLWNDEIMVKSRIIWAKRMCCITAGSGKSRRRFGGTTDLCLYWWRYAANLRGLNGWLMRHLWNNPIRRRSDAPPCCDNRLERGYISSLSTKEVWVPLQILCAPRCRTT
jgi:hypothetical protein